MFQEITDINSSAGLRVKADFESPQEACEMVGRLMQDVKTFYRPWILRLQYLTQLCNGVTDQGCGPPELMCIKPPIGMDRVCYCFCNLSLLILSQFLNVLRNMYDKGSLASEVLESPCFCFCDIVSLVFIEPRLDCPHALFHPHDGHKYSHQVPVLKPIPYLPIEPPALQILIAPWVPSATNLRLQLLALPFRLYCLSNNIGLYIGAIESVTRHSQPLGETIRLTLPDPMSSFYQFLFLVDERNSCVLESKNLIDCLEYGLNDLTGVEIARYAFKNAARTFQLQLT